MLNSKIIRVGLYERVSSEEQALRGYSIETQIANLEEYCKEKNLRIVDHYTDAGVSGGKGATKRAGMSRLLRDVELGKIDMILFTKLDRWFRNIKEYFKVQEILELHRVEWKAIQEDYDTTTANGRMAITIFLALAQNEREKGSERIKVVYEHKIKNKEACFGGKYNPLGYKKEKDENGITRLVIDPETEAPAREFWRIIKEGSTIMAAGRAVNAAFGLDRAYKEWNLMFNKEFYRGEYKGVKEYCPAYIDAKEWEDLKKVRTIKSTQQDRCYLFTGMLLCPKCNTIMCSNYTKSKDGKREYFSYRCRHNIVGRCDNGHHISELKTEKWLIANIKDRLDKFIFDIEVEKGQITRPKPKCDKAKIAEKIRRLNVVYMAGGKTDAEYTAEMADYNRLLAEAEKVAADTPPRDFTRLKELLSGDFEKIYITLEKEEKRQFWRSIIDTMTVEGNHIKDIIFKV
jgi:DNA invertase Pin-like site-specific DNA recombinase